MESSTAAATSSIEERGIVYVILTHIPSKTSDKT